MYVALFTILFLFPIIYLVVKNLKLGVFDYIILFIFVLYAFFILCNIYNLALGYIDLNTTVIHGYAPNEELRQAQILAPAPVPVDPILTQPNTTKTTVYSSDIIREGKILGSIKTIDIIGGGGILMTAFLGSSFANFVWRGPSLGLMERMATVMATPKYAVEFLDSSRLTLYSNNQETLLRVNTVCESPGQLGSLLES